MLPREEVCGKSGQAVRAFVEVFAGRAFPMAQDPTVLHIGGMALPGVLAVGGVH